MRQKQQDSAQQLNSAQTVHKRKCHMRLSSTAQCGTDAVRCRGAHQHANTGALPVPALYCIALGLLLAIKRDKVEAGGRHTLYLATGVLLGSPQLAPDVLATQRRKQTWLQAAATGNKHDTSVVQDARW